MDDGLRESPQATIGAESTIREVALVHFRYLAELMASVDLGTLERVVECLHRAQQQGSGVFILGNGGSAATASHFAVDLGQTLKALGGVPMRVTSLADNVPWMTAVANDEGYDNVFAEQLQNCLRPHDVVIVISASGNSRNLLRAVDFARVRGAVTIALVGFHGGALLRTADVPLFVPSAVGFYGPTEDLHTILGHVIVECLSRLPQPENNTGRS